MARAPKGPKAPIQMFDFEIIDPRAKKGDRYGQLGGIAVVLRGDKATVRMSAAQAQYFLDQGTIKAL